MMKDSKIRLMEVCGTHTMAIAKAGIKRLLPDRVELISGPGCPVCVTSQGDIDKAQQIALAQDVIMTSFGDMMRVPGSKNSLQDLKAQGHDIRIVYSCLDALAIARKNPDKRVVFMGVGFETTSPTVAATILQARREKIKNFFVLSNFKLIFPALETIAGAKDLKIDGFICPGHVSVITGSLPYAKIARHFKKPCVITGFDTADILKGIERLINLIKGNKNEVEIEYKRAVKKEGNKTARKVLNSVFDVCDARWRGFGEIKKSGLKIKKAFRDFDASREFNIKTPRPEVSHGCLCGEVLKGAKTPLDCKLFKKRCTPQAPIGPCMVSTEGTCAAYYRYA